MKVVAIFTLVNTERFSSEIILTSSGIEVDGTIFKWSDLSIQVGGNRSELLHFASKDMKFYLRITKEISQELKSYQNENINASLKHHNGFFKKELTLVIALLIALIGLFALFLGMRSKIVDAIVATIPFEYERQIGGKISEIGLGRLGRLASPKLEAEVKRLIKPLSDVLPSEYQELDISIGQSEEINAFAAPGGFIIINIGLLRNVDSCGELLGVVAHEMAHVVERHALRTMVGSVSLYTFLSLFLGDVTSIGAVLFEQGASFYNLSYSRELETRADNLALTYLAEIGYGPEGLILFFEKMNKKEGQVYQNETVKKFESFFSTHPGFKKRKKSLLKEAQKYSLKSLTNNCDLGAMKQAIEI